MKAKNFCKIGQVDSSVLRERILEGLGARPESFKYKGAEALWIHWGEFESFDEAFDAWSKVEGKEVEICVSSPSSGSIIALGGLVLQGIPSYHFPIDVHSYYDKSGKRFIIPKEQLEERKQSILWQFLQGVVDIEEQKGYDEAWLNAKNAIFLGFISASYEKSIKDFLNPKNEGDRSQFLSILPGLKSTLQKGYRCWLAGPRGAIPEEVDLATLKALEVAHIENTQRVLGSSLSSPVATGVTMFKKFVLAESPSVQSFSKKAYLFDDAGDGDVSGSLTLNSINDKAVLIIKMNRRPEMRSSYPSLKKAYEAISTFISTYNYSLLWIDPKQDNKAKVADLVCRLRLSARALRASNKNAI